MSHWTGLYAIVVSNGVLKNSSDVFYILDPDVGGAETFSVPINASGDLNDEITDWGRTEPGAVMTTTEYNSFVVNDDR